MSGWLRLWIVLVVAWGLLVGTIALAQNEPYDGDYIRMYGIFFAAWALPAFGLLLLGYAFRWIRRGFENRDSA